MMNFEEFIVALAKLKKVNMKEQDTDMSYNDAIFHLERLFGDFGYLKTAYNRYIIGRFEAGCPRMPNRHLIQEESGVDIGCVTNSDIGCYDCWARCLDWMESKSNFWRLDNEI